MAAIDRLEAFPMTGRVVPEVADYSLREVIHGADRIVNRVRADSLEIITVHHAARLLRV